ncbi:MAG: hypothetical protein F7C38_06950 [Desulfurococcales archaeon]|nr:hypothetical protein [Desulfurococcales archaeon]
MNAMRHAITAALTFLALIILAPISMGVSTTEVTVETPDASENKTITVNCEGLELLVHIRANTRNDTTRITILGKGLASGDRIKVLACITEILQSQALQTLGAETPAKAMNTGTAGIKTATALTPYSLENQETPKAPSREQQSRGEKAGEDAVMRALIAMITGLLGGLFFARIGRL